MKWAELRGKHKADVVIIVRACRVDGDDNEERWNLEWDSAHWLDGVGDDLPDGLAAAVSGLFWRLALANSAGETIANVATKVGERLWERLRKE